VARVTEGFPTLDERKGFRKRACTTGADWDIMAQRPIGPAE
jgi:hypothetical protein